MKKPEKVKACIFDLDGTILYTLESVARAGNRMLRSLGLPEQPLDDFRFHCGDGSRNLVERCIRAAGGTPTEETIARGDALNRQFLAEDPSYRVRPYEGIPEVLLQLKRRGILLAVFSNKPDDAAQTAVRNAFGGLFDYIQGQTAEVPIKPDPAGALAAAAALGADPGECMYFGDTWTDMQTGRNAGMYTVGVLWGYRGREELADNGADAFAEVPADILKLLEGDL